MEADLTRREKLMVSNVRSFIEAEALRFTAAIKRETDGYVAELSIYIRGGKQSQEMRDL